MDNKETPRNVIETYRKHQQAARRAPLMIGIAALLLIAGAAFIIFWLLGPDKPQIALFTTPTPTETATATATQTSTATATATFTLTQAPTFTVTATATQSGPFLYKVVEGDSCYTIAAKHNVDLGVLIAINNLDPTCPIRIGDTITIPGPDTQLPTETPLPENLRAGSIILYTVKVGDSLLSIALNFNSTMDAIKKENNIVNENDIQVGQQLKIPVNIVTAVPTSTALPPTPTGATPTSTRAISFTATPTR